MIIARPTVSEERWLVLALRYPALRQKVEEAICPCVQMPRRHSRYFTRRVTARREDGRFNSPESRAP